MKRFLPTLLLLSSSFVAAHAEQLVPAGSVLQCTVSEKISSKVTNVGDPVICQLSRAELYGRSVLPYGSYLVGRFEEYKDPGHFVGKGWMELKFDRLVVGNDTVLPLTARVIASSGKNPVDRQGRIDGSGHATKDTVEWFIPILWPLDLINLPRRGPSPVLKPETRLTLKLIDDLGIPTKTEVQHQLQLIRPHPTGGGTTGTAGAAARARRAQLRAAAAVPASVSAAVPAPAEPHGRGRAGRATRRANHHPAGGSPAATARRGLQQLPAAPGVRLSSAVWVRLSAAGVQGLLPALLEHLPLRCPQKQIPFGNDNKTTCHAHLLVVTPEGVCFSGLYLKRESALV